MLKVWKIIGWGLLGILALATIVWFGFLRPEPPPISADDRAKVTLMPLPAEMKLHRGEYAVSRGLKVRYRGTATERIERAVERFHSGMAEATGLEVNELKENGQLVIEFRGTTTELPGPGDDESYRLRITPRRIRLEADTETGIIYGLESLRQLTGKKGEMDAVEETEAAGETGPWVLPALALSDAPRYRWRGLMIDACRHWIPKEVILRNLDAMAALKMNVFHWHLSEYQAFRVESKVFPRLHEMGSGGEYYSQEEIRQVVRYAADRGIRVVPEFDLPGHSTSWLVGYPELGSAPGPYRLDTVYGVLDPVLDPTREEIYEFLDRFFGEMSTLFPDPFVHIGGDEVMDTHWMENEQIRAFMEEKGLEDSHALQAYFNQRLGELLTGHGKKMMGWDEILHPELPAERVVVQTWRDHASLWESARMGFGAVLSAGYYLDFKQPAGYHYQIDPEEIRGAVTIEIDSSRWRGWDYTLELSDMAMKGSLYLFGEGEELRGIIDFLGGSLGFENATFHEGQLLFTLNTNFGEVRFDTRLEGDSIAGTARLSMFNMDLQGVRSGGSDTEGGRSLPEFRKIEPLTGEQRKNLLGGEACMWTEMADGVTIESRIWPRAAAVAEKLWSPKELTGEENDMYRRIWVLSDRLEGRGLKHRSYRVALLEDMAPERFSEPLLVLTEVLQEDRFFNRMSLYEPQLYTTTPLNRMVDAVPAESEVAWKFGEKVDRWIETGDPGVGDELSLQLKRWQTNHSLLETAFARSERLQEVEVHSRNLSELATIGLTALEEPLSLSPGNPSVDSILTRSAEARGGCILPLPAHIQKLVAHARQMK